MNEIVRYITGTPIRTLLFLSIIGVAIRLLLAPFLTMHYDMAFWSGTINDITSGDGLYDGKFYWYTPIWGYFLSMTAFIMNTLCIDTQGLIIQGMNDAYFNIGASIVTGPVFNKMIKIPLIISDLLVSLFIYLIIKKITSDERKAIIGFAIWLFCPLAIWTSGIQAQFDTIAVLGMMVSVLFLLNKRYMLAGTMLSFGACAKIFPALIFPLMLAYIYASGQSREQKIKGIVGFAIGFLAFTVLMFLGPIVTGNFDASLGFLSSRLDQPAGSGNSLLNWDNILYVMPMIALFVICMSVLLAKMKDGIDERFLMCAGLTFASLFMWPLFPTVPQYILVLLPFMIILLSLGYEMKLPIISLSLIITISVIMWTGPSIVYPIAMYTDILSIETLEAIAGPLQSIMGSIYEMLEFVKFIPALLMIYFIFIKHKGSDNGGDPDNATHG